MGWLTQAPLLVALFALVYLPGYLCLRALAATRWISAAIAPAITFAIVGVGAGLAGALEIRWGLWFFLACVAFAAAISLAARRVLDFSRANQIAAESSFRAPTAGSDDTEAPGAPALRRLHAGSLALALAIGILPILLLADPWAPSTQADPMFHYNAVNAVAHTGDASMLTAIAPNYGIAAIPTVYPTVWHAILALSGGPAMPASHLLAYVVIPVIWVIGADFFMRMAFPGRRAAWAIAPALIAVIPYFPNFLTVSRGFWPNSLALAVLPTVAGLLAVTVRVVSGPEAPGRWRAAITLALVGAAATVGMGLAHPGVVFALLWPLILPLGWIAGSAIATAIRGRPLSRAQRLGAAAAVIYAASWAALFAVDKVRVFFGRSHPRSWDTGERLASLRIELERVPLWAIIAAGLAGLAVLAAAGLLVRYLWRMREARWLVLAWFAQWLVLFGAYVDGTVFSTVAGIWYHDPKRIMAVQGLITAALLALALGRSAVRWGAVGHGVFAAAVVLAAIGVRITNVYQDARPAIGPDRPVDSSAELELFSNLAPGSLILGDPTTGIGYAPAYANVDVVFPQVNFHPDDVEGLYLIDNFAAIHTDPRVCEILSARGIGYYYSDAALVYQKRDRAETWPGLYGVDTSQGFTEIAESDGGTLWRIDSCGPIPEPQWWNLDARK